MKEEVILVDRKDQPIGSEEKIKAHENAVLHRAFSIFIFNSKKEMLLQKRSKKKYHSPNLWTNACCSHPRPNESILNAAHRKLKQELNFDTELEEKFSFIYKAEVGNNLIEHEFDHVLFGFYDDKVKPNPEEASEVKWIKVSELLREVKEKPEEFTEWFKIALKEMQERKLI